MRIAALLHRPPCHSHREYLRAIWCVGIRARFDRNPRHLQVMGVPDVCRVSDRAGAAIEWGLSEASFLLPIAVRDVFIGKGALLPSLTEA